jgi:hypothetical protein
MTGRDGAYMDIDYRSLLDKPYSTLHSMKADHRHYYYYRYYMLILLITCVYVSIYAKTYASKENKHLKLNGRTRQRTSITKKGL